MTEKSVTCSVVETNGATATKLVIHLDLASKSDLHSFTTIEQNHSQVTTEQIDTSAAAYVRYTSIKSGQPGSVNQTERTSQVLNVWSNDKLASPSLFSRTALGNCVVPLASLPRGRAEPFMRELRSGKILQVDYSQTKRETIQGKPVVVYEVAVQPQPYVDFVKRVAVAYGLKDFNSVESADYVQKSPEQMKFYINAGTRRLEKIVFNGRERTITFSNYGKISPWSVPVSAVEPQELQKRFEAR